ncbi:hypothetical protein MRB53_018532 [Persea americana]|uniref:Uncharacterized protein n=1 Tax=Persea americana TaxID=3435 RepID=A0ACC2M8V6_PERAE|nr:hypothetical protein MRB53_018532 [Persea americana]
MSRPHHIFIYICTFILTVSNGYPVNRTIPACPFWLSNGAPTPQYCGYPGFNIPCNIQHQPIFHLPNHHKYYVRNINYPETTINLFDMDLMGETCPRPRHNTTTPPNTLPLLDYSPLNLKLTIFFNCSSANSSYGGEIRCLGNTTGNNKTSFVFRGGDVPEFEWSKYCEESVVVPVLATEAEGGNYIDFPGLLLKGFDLDWDSGDEIVCCARSLMEAVGMAVTVENSAVSVRMGYMPDIAMMVRSLYPSSYLFFIISIGS